jgi:adenosylmethionine-8-amino-7-oxononanoate aminotransferase
MNHSSIKQFTFVQFGSNFESPIANSLQNLETRAMDHNDLVAKDKRFIWHPFTDMNLWLDDDPIIIESGEGSELIDTQGNRYIDAVSSLWTNVHGHRVEQIDQAVRDQLDKIAHSTLLGLANVPSIEFAARLAPFLPGDLERIFFSDSGATAVEIAVKLAYCHWVHNDRAEKKTFVRFTGAYHGDTIGSVSVGGIETFHELFRPLLFNAPIAPYPFCYQCPLGLDKSSCSKECFEKVEAVFSENADQCAGIIIEPLIQGASGMRKAPAGFLRFLKDLCDRFELLLIVDEVATGFGRTGTFFACEQENVVPDLLCMAKGISGGYLPLAATAVGEKVFDSFINAKAPLRTFFHGHTYTGNPLACAAGLASLALFEQNNVIENLQPKIRLLEQGLSDLAKHRHVGDVRNAGMMCGIELVQEKSPQRPFDPAKKIGAKVCGFARKHGVLLRPLGDVLVINPPLGIEEEALKKVLHSIRLALAEMFD